MIYFDFFTGSLIFDKKINRLTYDKLTFVNLSSLHAYKFYDPQFSWMVTISAERIYDLDCQLCHKLNARGYMGPTMRPKTNMALSLLTGVFAESSKYFDKGYRVGLGIEGNMLFQLGKYFKIGIFDEIRFSAIGRIKKDYYNQFSIKQSFFPQTNSEWRFDSYWVSKFKSFSNSTKIFQLNYGIFY